MMCPKCGAYISDDATFCPKCGTAVSNNTTVNSGGYSGGMPPQQQNNNNGGNKGLIILICGIAAAIIFVVAAIITFLLLSGNSPFEPKETPTPAPTAAPTAAPTEAPIVTAPPQVTPQIIYVPQPDENPEPPAVDVQPVTGYRTYYSDKYDFSCDYPAGFTPYDDHGTLTLYTVQSPDGAGVEKIVAKPNEGETVRSSAAEFVSSHPGTVTYESVGSDYYAYTINNGSASYYKYCKFANGNLYWFEFTYPSSQEALYDRYINDVYSSFSY